MNPLLKSLKQQADLQYKLFTRRYGQQIIDILEFPVKLVLSPFTLAYDIAGSAPRGFGIPEFVSKLSYSAIFVILSLPSIVFNICVLILVCKVGSFLLFLAFS